MAPDFAALCARCNADRTMREGKRERRKMKNGNVIFDMEFYFECTTCGNRAMSLRDGAGRLHKFRGKEHVSFEIPSE